LIPLTGLFRGCEGRCGNAGTTSVFRPLTSPILVALALPRWGLRVFHFEQIGRVAGTVGRALAWDALANSDQLEAR
jgi:hypothetical protein